MKTESKKPTTFLEWCDNRQAELEEWAALKVPRRGTGNHSNTTAQIKQTAVTNLKRLGKRRRRYEEIQNNKKIPAKLRKQIAVLELQVAILEGSGDSSHRYRRTELTELLKQADRHLNPPIKQKTLNPIYTIGSQHARQSISRAYDSHVWDVLSGHFQQFPKIKGTPAQVQILAMLPNKAEYLEIKIRHFTYTLLHFVIDAYEIVSDLQSEMEEAYDNTPDSLQESAVGQAREEAASVLSEITEIDVPDLISSISTCYFPPFNQSSRRDRAATASDMFRVAIDAARKLISTSKLKKSDLKEIEEFCDDLENHAIELDDVQFPGMFG